MCISTIYILISKFALILPIITKLYSIKNAASGFAVSPVRVYDKDDKCVCVCVKIFSQKHPRAQKPNVRLRTSDL